MAVQAFPFCSKQSEFCTIGDVGVEGDVTTYSLLLTARSAAPSHLSLRTKLKQTLLSIKHVFIHFDVNVSHAPREILN